MKKLDPAVKLERKRERDRRRWREKRAERQAYNKRHSKAWYQTNRETVLGKQAEYRAKNPEKNRQYYEANREAAKAKAKANYYRTLYGLTADDIARMDLEQESKCAICSAQFDKSIQRGRGARYVDHDHETGKVRGLLCHHCNSGLGYFLDDPDKLAAAIAYLKRHQP